MYNINLKDTMEIAEFKYPPEKNTFAFIFDLCSCHKTDAENDLNISRMKVRLEKSSHADRVSAETG